MKFFALWLDADYMPAWAGPFSSNVTARAAVPASAVASVIASPIPMTSGERRDAEPILGLGSTASATGNNKKAGED